MENLSNNQELLYLVISFFILLTLMCDSGGVWKGEVRGWSLLGVKGLTAFVVKVYDPEKGILQNLLQDF